MKEKIINYEANLCTYCGANLNCGDGYPHDCARPDDWEAFKAFAILHPVEAYDSRKVDFLAYMKHNGYNCMSEKAIEELINEYRKF